MNFKKISALACTMTILGGMATATPVFAATTQTVTTTNEIKVPVIGKVGAWQDGNTDPSDPSGSGSAGVNGEISKPDNVKPENSADINVTVPTSMTFDVVTNTTDGNPVLASGVYQITNNGQTAVNMEANYEVTNPGGIDLCYESYAALNANVDGTTYLGVNLMYGDSEGTANTSLFGVQDGASTLGVPIKFAKGASKTFKFESSAEGMEDVKLEAEAGTFNNQTKVTQGNVNITFQLAK